MDHPDSDALTTETKSWLSEIDYKAKIKKSVFQVTSLKILGRVGTHIFQIIFFWKKI